MTLRELLDAVACGDITPQRAEQYLDTYGFVEVGFHRLDTQRELRTGMPEVVLGARKTIEQLLEIIAYFGERQLPLLVTKVSEEKANALQRHLPQLVYDKGCGVLSLGGSKTGVDGQVAVVSAGSSDYSVAEEAARTLEFFGAIVARVYDCGVAGLHRLFGSAELVASADVIIAVAGMEGALASVIGGLFARPIIAVPTSVGYGASFDGLAALLAMLNSCAPGVTVVNIDNGFGAAVAARSILRLVARNSERAARDVT